MIECVASSNFPIVNSQPKISNMHQTLHSDGTTGLINQDQRCQVASRLAKDQLNNFCTNIELKVEFEDALV